MRRPDGFSFCGLAVVSTLSLACTAELTGSGSPAPGAGVPGAPPDASQQTPEVPQPTGCSAPARRVWKLTPPQLQASLAAIAALPDVATRLRGSLSGALGGYSNEEARLEMSGPHVATLFELAKAAAETATQSGGVAAPCLTATSTTECAATLLSELGARAFRRPLTGEEQTRYSEFFARELAASDAPTALSQLVSALVLSPHFQYRTELGTPAGADFQLTSFERAQILSYGLADVPPDAELKSAASEGRLSTAVELKGQALRLLEGSTTATGLLRFFDEHLLLDSVENVNNRDPMLYPAFSAELMTDLHGETTSFVREVLWGQAEGRAQLATLFAGDFSMLNERLATLYGISGVTGPELRRTPLPSDRQRVGLLTQGSFLARLSGEQEGDLVKRGRFVRERLLCGTIPPPPPNVNAVPPPPSEEVSQRERMARHSSDPSCAGCHQLMDPLGFAFLGYDAIGGYRTTDAGKPIDATGSFDDGSGVAVPYDGAVELSRLMATSTVVQNCFSEKLYRYLSGRVPAPDQVCAVADAARAFQSSQGNMLELAAELVVSEALSPRREVP